MCVRERSEIYANLFESLLHVGEVLLFPCQLVSAGLESCLCHCTGLQREREREERERWEHILD